MSWIEWFEALSYVVTVVGLPLAIAVFVYEKRKERQQEESQIYQRLSDDYVDFLRLSLDNVDLKLLGQYVSTDAWSEEQKERKRVLFAILVSVFERAYIDLHEQRMNRQSTRRWLSWEDYMRDWCRRADFRDFLPELLEGEDDEFTHYILAIAEQESNRPAA